ncbi:MAG: hypothetical protein ABL999_13640 [Pyrinomonadaceae bacterium]
MKATRKTKITIETRESKFVRFGREEISFCRGCAAPTRHLPVAQIAVFLAVTEKAIFRLVESDRVHSFETPEGYLMICTEYAAYLPGNVEEVKVLEIGDKL